TPRRPVGARRDFRRRQACRRARSRIVCRRAALRTVSRRGRAHRGVRRRLERDPMKRTTILAAILLSVVSGSGRTGIPVVSGFGRTVIAAPDLPELTQPVNDFAHVIDADNASRMEQMIRALQAKTGDVVVVASVPNLEPYGDINEYAV